MQQNDVDHTPQRNLKNFDSFGFLPKTARVDTSLYLSDARINLPYRRKRTSMPRTYGEVCPCSFADLLSLGGDTNKVLIDCGSGHGVLVKAAVEQFNCIFAIGIEKYKEPAAIAAQLFTSSCGSLQAKMRFLLEDMNDTDIPQQLDGLTFATLILFCNNLAFHEGTVHRYACQAA